MTFCIDVRIRIQDENGSYIRGSLNKVTTSNRLVIFAHGSGSDSNSLRNQYLSKVLNDGGISTLLVDLLTENENCTDQQMQSIRSEFPGAKLNKFNIGLLSDRLAVITRWALNNEETRSKSIGYFGGSTGAAAAFVTSAQDEFNRSTKAIVARSGRPDLAYDILHKVASPSLLIVGSKDARKIIRANNNALNKIGADKKQLIKIKGGTHLFEEHGLLENIAHFAVNWFNTYV